MQKKLSFTLLFNQTYQFICSKLWQVILISVIVGIVFTLIAKFFFTYSVLSILQSQVVMGSMSYSISAAFSSLFRILLIFMVINVICQTINISTVSVLSSNGKLESNSLISKATSTFLKLLGFNLIYALILFFVAIFLVLFLFLLSYILPQRLLALLVIISAIAIVLYIQTVYGFFIGSVTGPTSKSFFQIFTETHRAIKQYFLAGSLIVLGNFFCLLLINWLLSNVPYGEFLVSPITNFIGIFVIYFFYQAYITLNEKEPVLENTDTTNNQLII